MMYLRIVSVLCATVPFLAGCDRSFRVNFDLQQRYVTLITEPQGAMGTTPLQNQPVAVISKITGTPNDKNGDKLMDRC